jgi:hypothetical protein
MSGDTLFIKRLRNYQATVNASFTRPADTTAYAAGDVVCNSTSAPVVVTFANMAREAAKGGYITALQLLLGSVPTTYPDLELHLFDTSPTIQNDNAAWAPTDSDMEKSIGLIRLPSGLATPGGSNNLVYDIDALAKPFNCAAGATSLYGILVTRTAYTPGNAEKYAFRLHATLD